jgi:UDP-N-acetylglucosamine:LPS N-acetylglucosamine transferase
MKLCLVCSTGGHLLQLYLLKDMWMQHERFWVTFPGRDSEYFLGDEMVYFAYHPTNRSIGNLIKNFFLALKILRQENPDVILSTGAGVAVPFIIIGRMLGKKTIYLESMTRCNTLSLAGKLVYHIVNHFLVQNSELADKYKKAIFKGQVL